MHHPAAYRCREILADLEPQPAKVYGCAIKLFEFALLVANLRVGVEHSVAQWIAEVQESIRPSSATTLSRDERRGAAQDLERIDSRYLKGRVHAART